jgi:hypothetical protein
VFNIFFGFRSGKGLRTSTAITLSAQPSDIADSLDCSLKYFALVHFVTLPLRIAGKNALLGPLHIDLHLLERRVPEHCGYLTV